MRKTDPGRDSAEEVRLVAPYSMLAHGYDLVMRHVDYATWAAYLVDRLVEHKALAHVESILELGCGTGSLAIELQEYGPFTYVASDGSERMLEQAAIKIAQSGADVELRHLPFQSFEFGRSFDLIILLYDGLNYLLSHDEVRSFLRSAYQTVREGGWVIFDQSTTANSENNEQAFDDEGSGPDFEYIRRSHYDRSKALHVTDFEILKGGKRFRERHVQRAYDIDEIGALLEETPFSIVACYDDFSDRRAGKESERIHWVLRRAPEEENR